MNLWLQLLLHGLAAGSLYAVIGLSFGIIFNTSRVFHFAHSAIFSLGAYVVYWSVAALSLPLPVAIILAMLVTAAAGMACEGLLYRPLRMRGSTPLLSFLASFALMIILQNVLLLVFGGIPVSLSDGAIGAINVFTVRIPKLVIIKIAVGLLSTAFVAWLIFRTALGKRLRAIVSNPEMARTVGIDIDRSYLLAYAIGSALTVPSATVALFDQGVSPDVGETPLLIATVAVFAGGVGAFLGGALGGLALGLIGATAIYWTNASFQLAISLGTLTVFLLLRPNGFLGVGMRRA